MQSGERERAGGRRQADENNGYMRTYRQREVRGGDGRRPPAGAVKAVERMHGVACRRNGWWRADVRGGDDCGSERQTKRLRPRRGMRGKHSPSLLLGRSL